jgi:hypothetical protein
MSPRSSMDWASGGSGGVMVVDATEDRVADTDAHS